MKRFGANSVESRNDDTILSFASQSSVLTSTGFFTFPVFSGTLINVTFPLNKYGFRNVYACSMLHLIGIGNKSLIRFKNADECFLDQYVPVDKNINRQVRK